MIGDPRLLDALPLSLQDARRLVTGFVEHYNTVRLHSAIGYIAPADKLSGKEAAIFAARDQKLLQAREIRKTKRNQNNTDSLAGALTFSQLTLNQHIVISQHRDMVLAKPIDSEIRILISTHLSTIPFAPTANPPAPRS